MGKEKEPFLFEMTKSGDFSSFSKCMIFTFIISTQLAILFRYVIIDKERASNCTIIKKTNLGIDYFMTIVNGEITCEMDCGKFSFEPECPMNGTTCDLSDWNYRRCYFTGNQYWLLLILTYGEFLSVVLLFVSLLIQIVSCVFRCIIINKEEEECIPILDSNSLKTNNTNYVTGSVTSPVCDQSVSYNNHLLL